MKLSMDSHPGKGRVLAAMVLTAGLGMTGVVSASASGAASPTTAPAGHGKRVVCVVRTGPGGAASLTTAGKAGTLAGKAGAVILTGGPGPAGTFAVAAGNTAAGNTVAGEIAAGKATAAGRTTVKVVGGKVYVDGKQVAKGESPVKCGKLPPLPPGGKGRMVVCVAKGAPGAPGLPGAPGPVVGTAGPVVGTAGSAALTATAGRATAAGRTTVKVVGGKVYVDGKPVAKGKSPVKCAKLPPLPPLGKGGGESGTTARGDADATSSEWGVTSGGAPATVARG